jgi:hypothetical protein
MLPIGRLVHLLQKVSIHLEIIYKSLIAFHQKFNRLVGADFLLQFFS